MSAPIAFKGELQLLGWTESDKGGRSVKFQCSGDEAEHPFKVFRSKARFMAVLVEIGDDEQPVEPQERIADPATGLLASNLCALTCKDRDFWTWIEAQVWGIPITSEQKAAEIVKELLGIESRTELDTNPGLAQKFFKQMLHPFNEWKQSALRVRKA